jgi:antigen flippase
VPTSRLDEQTHPDPTAAPSLGDAAEASPFGNYRWTGRRAVAETVIVNGLLMGLGAVSGILAARLLGPQGRGALALGIAVAGLMTVIVGLGLQQAFAYLVAAQRETAGMAVGLTLLSGALIGGMSVGLGWLLVLAFIKDESVSEVVRIGLLAVPGSAIAMNTTGIFQGLRLGRRFNLSRLLYPTAYCIGIVGVAFFGNRVTPQSLASVYVLGSAVCAVGAYCLLPTSLQRPRLPSREFANSALRYGTTAVVGAAAYATSAYLALPLLGALGGLRETGYYAVGLSYAIPVTFVASAIAIHSLPDIAAADRRAHAGLVRQRVMITFVTLLPMAAVALIAAPLLVPTVFGEEFRPAVAGAQVLVLAQAFRAIANVLGDIARGLGRPGVPSLGETAGILAMIALLPVVIPEFGGEGAAVVVAAANSAVAAVVAFGIRNELRSLPSGVRPG